MKTVAVLGASNDRGKFGNKAVRAYLQQGFAVYPVNLKVEHAHICPGKYTAAVLRIDKKCVYRDIRKISRRIRP